MTRFYEYLFYLIYKFYAGKEKGAASSAAGIIGGLQAMNVLTVFLPITYFLSRKEYFNKLTVLSVFLFFQITTYIRYIYRKQNNYQETVEKWLKMTETEKIRVRFLSFIYITLSISFFFGLAIYLGGKS